MCAALGGAPEGEGLRAPSFWGVSGRGRVCGRVPASPAGVRARDVRQKQEKMKPSVHFPRPVALFSPPASLPPLGGFLAAPAWIFQQEVNSRKNPSWKLMGAGRGEGGREAEPAGRGQETGWGEGRRPRRPVGQPPCSPRPGCPLCRRGPRPLACVLELVHMVSHMTFVRWRRRGGRRDRRPVYIKINI